MRGAIKWQGSQKAEQNVQLGVGKNDLYEPSI